MAADPRQYFVKQCDKARVKDNAKTQEKKDFFNSLGKIGDIELLNNSALGGDVGQGLRDLAKISNSIRTGDPTSAIPKNGTDVLIATGISDSQAAQVSQFNPGAVNTAMAQADSIAEQVRGGNFSLSDVPNAFSDIQNLSTLSQGIFVSKDANDSNRDLEICQASPWATDLISYAPKYKFLFVMEFEFTEPFEKAMGKKQMAFVVKNCTRPNITFEHEEVNMYNFWTRIPKRTSYEPMTMRFYDDNLNYAMILFTAYLKAVSPIANLDSGARTEHLDNILESQSMNFGNEFTKPVIGGAESGFFGTNNYASSFGPVGDFKTKNMFKRITLYEIYSYGHFMNEYQFVNPKVLQMELDDKDVAENGNGNEVSMQFAYDVVHIHNNVPLALEKNKNKIKDLTTGGVYPLIIDDKGEPPTIIMPTSEEENALEQLAGGVGTVVGGVTGAITGAIDAGTGLVSNAFQSVNEFAGSIFSSGAAAAKSAENAVRGSLGQEE